MVVAWHNTLVSDLYLFQTEHVCELPSLALCPLNLKRR